MTQRQWVFSLWGIGLALCLVSPQAPDVIFTLFFALALWDSKIQWERFFPGGWSLFNVSVLVFTLSSAAGYLIAGDLKNADIEEILQLRWVLGFYAVFYVGRLLAKAKIALPLNTTVVPLILLWIFLKQWQSSPEGLISFQHRLQGFYEHPNHLGLAFVIMWSFYFSYTLIPDLRSKKYLLGILSTLALLSFAIFCTYTRNAWLAALAALAIGLIYSKNKWTWLSFGMLSVAGLLAFSLNLFLIKDRLLYSFDISERSSQGTRLLAWRVNWNIFLDHPFGVGLEAASRYYPQYYNKLNIPENLMVYHAHNQFFQILSGAGFIGLCSFFIILILGFLFFHRGFYFYAQNLDDKRICLAGLLGLTTFTVGCIFDCPLRIHECRNILFLLVGTAAGYIYERHSSIPRSSKEI